MTAARARTSIALALALVTASGSDRATAAPARRHAPPDSRLADERAAEADAVGARGCQKSPIATEAATPVGWFYLGYPGRTPHARDARKVAAAITEELGVDPRCIKVVVLDHEGLTDRYRTLDANRGPKYSIAGFHRRSLGTDSTVFVEAAPGQLFSVVLAHEVLHAYSHRFSAEAARRRVTNLVEGVTEYFTRLTALRRLGVAAKDYQTGYGGYLAFATRLAAIVGDQALLRCYRTDGYLALEGEVADALGGPALREAARALQADDVPGALELLGG